MAVRRWPVSWDDIIAAQRKKGKWKAFEIGEGVAVYLYSQLSESLQKKMEQSSQSSTKSILCIATKYRTLTGDFRF